MPLFITFSNSLSMVVEEKKKQQHGFSTSILDGPPGCFTDGQFTENALKMHMRKVHNIRNPIRLYVFEDGVVPSCKTDLKSPLRCLSHSSDSRRPRRREQLLSRSFATLTAGQLQDLDDAVRMSRASARHQGHTHPIAEGTATTASGKRVGRVQQ